MNIKTWRLVRRRSGSMEQRGVQSWVRALYLETFQTYWKLCDDVLSQFVHFHDVPVEEELVLENPESKHIV